MRIIAAHETAWGLRSVEGLRDSGFREEKRVLSIAPIRCTFASHMTLQTTVIYAALKKEAVIRNASQTLPGSTAV